MWGGWREGWGVDLINASDEISISIRCGATPSTLLGLSQEENDAAIWLLEGTVEHRLPRARTCVCACESVCLCARACLGAICRETPTGCTVMAQMAGRLSPQHVLYLDPKLFHPLVPTFRRADAPRLQSGSTRTSARRRNHCHGRRKAERSALNASLKRKEKKLLCSLSRRDHGFTSASSVPR